MSTPDDLFIPKDYYEMEAVRETCHRAKNGCATSISIMAEYMSKYVKRGDILIPIPGRTGQAEHSALLCEAISKITMATIWDGLRGTPRESHYDTKKKGSILKEEDFGFSLISEPPTGKKILVDNVIDTGETMQAALRLIPTGMPLVYAQRNRTALNSASDIIGPLTVFSRAEIEEILNNLCATDNDAILFEGIQILLSGSLFNKKRTRESLSSISSFFSGSKHASLSELMTHIENDFFKIKDKETLYKSRDGNLLGVQLLNSTSDQAVIFLPDASEHRKYRASYFDQRGFYAHTTHDTYAEVLDYVWQQKFRTQTDTILEEWSSLESWDQGSKFVLNLQQLNSGLITWDEYVSRQFYDAYAKEFERIAQEVIFPNRHKNDITFEQLSHLLKREIKSNCGVDLTDDAALFLCKSPGTKLPNDMILSTHFLPTRESADVPEMKESLSVGNKMQTSFKP